MGFFSRFLTCANGTILRIASHLSHGIKKYYLKQAVPIAFTLEKKFFTSATFELWPVATQELEEQGKVTFEV